MNDRQIDVRALEALLNEPEIVAWLGLSKKEFDSLVDSKREASAGSAEGAVA